MKKMSNEKVEVMVEGGKATAGPAMGQAFGPLGVNIQEILAKINEKTADFKGMKVPVTVIVDTDDKSFDFFIQNGTDQWQSRAVSLIQDAG